ncbi:MAG: GTP-binding protein, partial [Promethearchaeota archaeon]
MSKTYKLKMVIGGASGSGKTSFLLGKPTLEVDYGNLGVSFKPVEVIINDDDTYQFIMWDLKTKNNFKFLYPTFCRGASGAFLCFDINDHQSFEELPFWINIVRKNAIIEDFKIPIILIGTKTDLNNREVSDDEIHQLMQQHDLDDVFFISIHDEDKKQKKVSIFKSLIEKIQPFYQIEDISIFIPREDNEFKEFLHAFSNCIICG